MAGAQTNVSDGRMDVFIAHADADVAFAEQLAAFLDDAGFRPAYVPSGARATPSELTPLIRGAESVVLVLTTASARAELCLWATDEAAKNGKRLIFVLPAPYNGQAPRGAPSRVIRFFADRSVPHSGFYDGQKQLVAALRANSEWFKTQSYVLERAMRWGGRTAPEDLLLRGRGLDDAVAWRDGAPTDARVPDIIDAFLAASIEREAAERAAAHAPAPQVRTMERPLPATQRAEPRPKPPPKPSRRDMSHLPPDLRYPPPYYPPHYPPPRPRRRFPVLRVGFLLAVTAFVVAIIASADFRAQTRAFSDRASQLIASMQSDEPKSAAESVAVSEYTPERQMLTGRAGANIRSYPLRNADVLVRLPARTALNPNGRLNVQGDWWFRVTLDDGRVGFVRQDVIAWGARIEQAAPAETETPAQTDTPPARPEQPALQSGLDIDPVQPAIEARAGRAGAKIRTGPARNSRIIVRVESGAAVTITGTLQHGGHRWFLVTLQDGREGFARDDVIVSSEGGAVRL